MKEQPEEQRSEVRGQASEPPAVASGPLLKCPVIAADGDDAPPYTGECWEPGLDLDRMRRHLFENGWTEQQFTQWLADGSTPYTQRPTPALLTSAQREAIIAAARSLIGVPFRHQGRDPETGLDCQGFLIALGGRVGYQFSREWPNNHHPSGNNELLREGLETEFRPLRSFEHAQPADVVLLRLPRTNNLHVSILVEGPLEAQLIHSLARDGSGAIVADVLRRWQKYVVNAFTWLPERFAPAP